jgi:hypothetical protein
MTGVKGSRLAIAAVLVLALVGCLAVLELQRRHPRVFVEAGGWGFSGHADVGGAFYAGDMALARHGESGVVTLRHLSANIVGNTSRAKVRFFVCRVDPSSGVAGVGTASEDTIHRDCETLSRAEGSPLRLSRTPAEQLVMGVFPTRPGGVKILGVDVDYTSGWQTGTQTTGGIIEVKTRS